MKTEALSAIVSKLAIGIATAATLAGSGAIITAQRDNAVQDARIQRVEATVEKIDRLDDKLDTTLRTVDALNARLEAKEKYDVSRQ